MQTKEIEALKRLFLKMDYEYNICQWIECLGSLQYIKETLLPSSVEDDVILNELKKRKSHLNKDNETRLLYKLYGN